MLLKFYKKKEIVAIILIFSDAYLVAKLMCGKNDLTCVNDIEIKNYVFVFFVDAVLNANDILCGLMIETAK